MNPSSTMSNARSRPATLRALWKSGIGCAQRLLPYASASMGSIVNGDFAQPILNRAFDWRLPSITGVDAVRMDSPVLQVAFSGKQPEQFEILSHFLPLNKSTAYVLQFQYKTIDLPRQTGLFWSLAGQEQSPLPPRNWSQAEWRFQAPAETDAWPLTTVAAPERRAPRASFSCGRSS